MNTVGLDYGEVESTVIAIAECANTAAFAWRFLRTVQYKRHRRPGPKPMEGEPHHTKCTMPRGEGRTRLLTKATHATQLICLGSPPE